MKQYLKLFLNWRIDVLMALGIVACLLLLSECEIISTFIITKAAGVALAYTCYKLSQMWDRQGKINKLDIFDVQ